MSALAPVDPNLTAVGAVFGLPIFPSPRIGYAEAVIVGDPETGRPLAAVVHPVTALRCEHPELSMWEALLRWLVSGIEAMAADASERVDWLTDYYQGDTDPEPHDSEETR